MYRVKTGRKPKDSIVDISIMAWFRQLQSIVDKMPDTDEYQISAPDVKTVYGMYQVINAFFWFAHARW